MNMPSKYKLTGDAKRLWGQLVEEFGTVLKERHKPLLFAMCQQWDLYQKCHAKLKRCEIGTSEFWKVYGGMSGSLKHFSALTKQFAMGINDELQFTVGGIPSSIPKEQKAESRIANLLSKIGGSEN